MAVSRVNGWTVVTPSEDSRLIYISNTGNDEQARAVKGRGYYLPSDPEIGPDPYNPVGPIVSYVTPREAAKKMRGNGWLRTDPDGREIVSIAERDRRSNLESADGGGWPDWVLFKRGETFVGDEGYQSPGWGFLSGNLGDMFRHGWGDNIVAGGAFRYEAGLLMGRSQNEPMVISAWGNPSDPRPIMSGGFNVAYYNFTVLSSLDVQPTPDGSARSGLLFGNANAIAYNWWKTIVEDCRSQGHSMIAIQGGDRKIDLTIRRCVFADGWNPGGHNSSPYNGLKDGAKLTYEECVFDKNGYKENPADATKWTGKFWSSLSAGELPDGTGVQPTRTWFDRNWYMSGDAGDTLVLRGNIAARTGGGAEQLRSGGLAYRNVFLFNHDGLLAGAPEDSYGVHDIFIVQNLFLHDDVFLPPGGWGMNNFCQGGNSIIAENIYAHPHSRIRGVNGPGPFFLWNARNYDINKRVLVGNVLRASTPFRGFASQRSLESLDHPILTVKNNEFAINQLDGYGYGGISRTTKSELDTVDENLYFGNSTSAAFTIGYGGSPASISARNRSFETWQSSGYDTNSQMISDWATFKSTANWPDPDRDIVSYMQTIDPNYIPDENVRVDYGVKIQQETPQLVKDSILTSHMNEEQRLLAARRFHAAVTFLTRARENRKGNWDSNYTAESLNDYIRVGFGKSSLSNTEYFLSLEDAFDFASVEEPCLVVELVPQTSSFSESGGTGSFNISTTNETCPWSASTNRDWLTLTQNASGVGSVGEISYSVAPNLTNSSRSGTINVGGQVHTVSQTFLQCSIGSIEPTSISVGSTGATGSISFSTSSSICSWEAVSDSSWLSITGGSTGTGENGTVVYSVEQNPLTFSRIGRITLDSSRITVTQEGSPSLEVGTHNHVVKGSYSGQIERIFNKDYFLDLNVPVQRNITKVTTETTSGTCLFELYSNNQKIMEIESSPNKNSVVISSNNSVLSGEILSIRASNNNSARDLRFSINYDQNSELS